MFQQFYKLSCSAKSKKKEKLLSIIFIDCLHCELGAFGVRLQPTSAHSRIL